MKQNELIQQMSPEELKKQVILSQLFFLLIGIILSFFFFDHYSNWFFYFKWDPNEILYYGLVPGLIIVIMNVILVRIIPKRYFDDGGINEKLFKDRSISDIFVIAFIVAISEELLFRGVIQTTFGFIFASSIFALVHIRYLKKPVLLISVLLVSFYIGYLFVLTENLLVTIFTHFIVDFLLGILIRFQK